MMAINHSEEEHVRDGAAMLEGREQEDEEDDDRGLISKLNLPADVDPAALKPWPQNKPLQPALFAASLVDDEVMKALEAKQLDFHLMLAANLDDDRSKGMSRGDASSHPPCLYILQDSQETVGLLLAVVDIKSLPGNEGRPGLVVKYCFTNRSLLGEPEFMTKVMKQVAKGGLEITFEPPTM